MSWTDRFSLKGKRALVTGASKGIGEKICEVLADAGADIAGVGRDKAGAIIEAGVDVPAESYYLRAIARGDIEAVKAVSEVSE